MFSFLRDPYVIALRSVSLPTYPPSEGYNRGEVLCAGFTIVETSNNMSLVRPIVTIADQSVYYYNQNKLPHYYFQISYYNQASPEVLPYISTDIAGLSSSFYHTFCSCSRYLTRNRLQSSSELPTGLNQVPSTDGPTCEGEADSLSAAVRSTHL